MAFGDHTLMKMNEQLQDLYNDDVQNQHTWTYMRILKFYM